MATIDAAGSEGIVQNGFLLVPLSPSLLMAILVFLVPESIFSDPTRLVLALFIGAWPIRTMEKSAERTTKVAQAAMAVTFGLATLSYAVVLLIQG